MNYFGSHILLLDTGLCVCVDGGGAVPRINKPTKLRNRSLSLFVTHTVCRLGIRMESAMFVVTGKYFSCNFI